MKYDVVMMVVPKNIELLKKSIPYILKNLGDGINQVRLVANKQNENLINSVFEQYESVIFVDEESIMPGLNLSRIKEIMRGICGKDHRAGWFYQQFLKMAYAYISEHEYYLVFDSDTIPLNPIHYFDEEGKPCFVEKIEYNKPYFDTMNKLFDGRVKRVNEKVSYIAENMMINRNIMVELIGEIQRNTNLIGECFYEKILNAIDKSVIEVTGFSEFETYGNYVMTFHPEKYNKMKLRTQRLGAFLLGDDPTMEQLEWAARDYDIMSFEGFGRRWLGEKTKQAKTRQKYTAKELFERYYRLNVLLNCLLLRKTLRYD